MNIVGLLLSFTFTVILTVTTGTWWQVAWWRIVVIAAATMLTTTLAINPQSVPGLLVWLFATIVYAGGLAWIALRYAHFTALQFTWPTNLMRFNQQEEYEYEIIDNSNDSNAATYRMS